MNAAEARRRSASIDIEPLSEELELVDVFVAGKGGRMGAADGEDAGVEGVQIVEVGDALEVAGHVARPEVGAPVEGDVVAWHVLPHERGHERAGGGEVV